MCKNNNSVMVCLKCDVEYPCGMTQCTTCMYPLIEEKDTYVTQVELVRCGTCAGDTKVQGEWCPDCNGEGFQPEQV